jgi:NADH dehydrogenase FAD-containing subunit
VLIIDGGGMELSGAFADLVRRVLKSDDRDIDPANLRIILIQSGLQCPASQDNGCHSFRL